MKTINAQSGIITLDFMFAIVIVFGISGIFFALTYTLTVVELTQYIVFSTARAHSAGNLTIDSQIAAAKSKYTSLVTNPLIKSIYRNGWFELAAPDALEIRSGAGGQGQPSFSSDYSNGANRPSFSGVRTILNAKIMHFKIPFVGATSPEDDSFKTKVLTIMLREPSQAECKSFMVERREAIRNLDPRFLNYPKKQEAFIPMEDNGC